jgi:hypothetical protein
MIHRFRLLAQLTITLGILVWVPGNVAKLVAFALTWVVLFGRVRGAEVTVFIIVNVLFAGMNIGALCQGVFRFEHPDFLGMPVWEFVMWGFYVLHLIRMVGGTTPGGRVALPLGLAIIFAVPFSTIPDQGTLTIVSGLIFFIALGFFHEKLDLAYAGYMIVVGALIEYVGVHSGQWSYPNDPLGGVPLWFIPMWGGVGLFTRRLVLPALRRFQPQ